ncbi:hypothetical protein EXIGLDRAFT_618770 [Exidia glandulosa HHB12029]|uniref:NADH dehydrogenase [ubiquinone] iron-sulfur protein 4, mitochondrial n=1 Tax=Exidia glandulosa HHB12029 TaxID=1314781 RepID=A0A165FFZ0_EXIGL|nr:hypothetical protein EXIGLDRAFT_618770 [Exidia glandulosa HHB12029]
MLRTVALAGRATRSLPRATRSLASQAAPAQPQPPAEPKTEGSVATTFGEKSDVPAAVEPQHVVTADVVSGAPKQLRHRVVRIYKPTPTTMQSGGSRNPGWRIDWDTAVGGGRWENPLMGWASSADYMQGTRMSFSTKEDAMRFADKQGWDYYVQAEGVQRIPPKNYAENYVYKPNTLRIARTK